MLYYKCPTCRTILANKQLIFEEELEKICKNDDFSFEEKEEEKMELLNRLELTRYCCRMRILTYAKLIEIIK
jgi:DNA-directed RNA polymerase subunit N (RpoN/RPB10)